jgi:hypothetical protein
MSPRTTTAALYAVGRLSHVTVLIPVTVQPLPAVTVTPRLFSWKTSFFVPLVEPADAVTTTWFVSPAAAS